MKPVQLWMRMILIPLWVCVTMALPAQIVITDSTSTPSLCFNDGTVQAGAAGGTGVYTFSIITGPAYPNITYPIVLAPGVTLFSAIPSGHFTLKVTDGAGHSATATVTIGGNYQFPNLSYNIAGSCINTTPQFGQPPYHFAISHTSQNIGFGAYQSSPNFCGLCNGVYWIRVLDSCQNFFTTDSIHINIPPPALNINCNPIVHDTISFFGIVTSSTGTPPFTFVHHSYPYSSSNGNGSFSHPIGCYPDTISITDACGRTATTIQDCNPLIVSGSSNCHAGSAVLNVSGGKPPYTITGSGGTSTTHNKTTTYNGLPKFPVVNGYNFTVTDSCGRVGIYAPSCQKPKPLHFTFQCPYDSTAILNNLDSICRPTTLTCLTCSPQQVVIIKASDTLPRHIFHGLDTATIYDIKIQDTCGYNYTESIQPYFSPVIVTDSDISCNDFILLTPQLHFPPDSPVTFAVSKNSTFLYDTAKGVFTNMPDGQYSIMVSTPQCLSTTVNRSVPDFGPRCAIPNYDSACNLVYDIFHLGPNFPETWYYHNKGTGVEYPEVAHTGNSGIYFNNIPAGSYYAYSDSGCRYNNIVIPSVTLPKVSASAFVNCSGKTNIIATMNPPFLSCGSGYDVGYVLYFGDSLITENTSGIFTTFDTGLYTIRLKFISVSNATIGPLVGEGNSHCYIDSVHIFATKHSIPLLSAKEVKVCGKVKANIPFAIFGGTSPYTLQILDTPAGGQPYPPVTVHTTSGVFPNVTPGIYTMVISDTCGISTSLSVAVLDTCSTSCGIQSAFTLSDSDACVGKVVSTHNLGKTLTNGTFTYQWLLNGNPYSTSKDTTFTFSGAGIYHIRLFTYLGKCHDSIDHTVKVVAASIPHLGSDTTICGLLHLRLFVGDKNTRWSTGVTDSTITVTTPGIYWAETNNSCGKNRDSIVIHQAPAIIFNIGNDTNVCVGDTVILHTHVDSAAYQWSTGGVDTFVILTAQPTNPVTLTVSKNNCHVSDSALVNFLIPPTPFSLGTDTFYCDSDFIRLRTGVRSTIWSTGVTDSAITVTQAGTITATISNICGTQRDTVHIDARLSPAGFTLIDTPSRLCYLLHDSVLIEAQIDTTQPRTTFEWSTGRRDTGYTSYIIVDTAGIYSVRVSNLFCSKTKSETIDTVNCTDDCLKNYAVPNAFSPNGDGVNPIFIIRHICPITPFTMHIYNRWGQMVFESDDINQGWDGTYHGLPQPNGVYHYWIAIGVDGKNVSKREVGTVTLIR